MDKHIWCIYTTEYSAMKKEGWTDAYYNRDALWNHDKWNSLDTKGYILHGSIIRILREKSVDARK